MRRWARRASGLLAALLAPAAPTMAWASDVRFWPSVAVSVPLGGQFQVKTDALVETTDTGASTGLNLVRVVVLRQAGDRAAFGGGYAQVHGETGGGVGYVEHRGVQELDLRLLGQAGALQLTSRTRLEERGRPSQRGVALRLRHQTRLDLPLAHSRVATVIWSEYFHNLNGAAWSGPAGPGMMLTFIGVRAPLTRSVSIEPGYLNRINFGAVHGQVDHIGALTVTIRF